MKKRWILLVLQLLLLLTMLNAAAASITITSPQFGVAQDKQFGITVATTEARSCRYSSPFEKSFDTMTAFDPTGSTQHGITGFELPAFGTDYDFFVNCNAGAEKAQLKLRADSTNPSITSARVSNSKIVQQPMETTLLVTTDEDAFCRYDATTADYAAMGNSFGESEISKSGYTTMHEKLLTGLADETSHSYNAACRDLSGRKTTTATISFTVNTKAEPEIINLTPQQNSYTSDNNIILSVSTNKNSACKYGNETPPAKQDGTFNVQGIKHETALQMQEGKYVYYFTCVFEGPKELSAQTAFAIDKSKPLMLWVNDSQNLKGAGEAYTYYTDVLEAKWKGEDNESGIKEYNYSIFEANGNAVLDWKTTPSSDVEARDLELENGKKYVFKVKAKNNAGLWSDIKESDGVTVDISLNTEQACRDGRKNGDETDTDCGGKCQSKCQNNRECRTNSDCRSGYCGPDKTCTAGSCSDGIKNQDETDVDCGGACKPCTAGDSCKANSDCQSNICTEGVCLPPGKCQNKALDDGETDIDCGGVCAELKSIKCVLGKKCAQDSDCASGACGVKGACVVKGDKDEDKVSDSADNCPLVYNPSQKDSDKDGTGDECDEDNDNDGMADKWEKQYGFNPFNGGDALLDADSDTLANLKEFQLGTNPKNKDTDGDGASDAAEAAKGSNPNDAKSKPGSGRLARFMLGMLVLLAIALAFGYFYYRRLSGPIKETKKAAEASRTELEAARRAEQTPEPRKYRPAPAYRAPQMPEPRRSSIDELQSHHSQLSGEEIFERLKRHTRRR